MAVEVRGDVLKDLWSAVAGGDVAATEAINDEIKRLRGTGKPVIASMGNLAASAGYSMAGQSATVMQASTTQCKASVLHKMQYKVMQSYISDRVHAVCTKQAAHLLSTHWSNASTSLP